MAFTITPYSIFLNTNIDNCNFGEQLTQGATDFSFIVSILKDNVVQQVDSGAKVTMILRYNYANTCGNSAQQSDYVLAPGDSNYDITITDGKINIPGRIEITNAKGTVMLELKIEDGSIAYTRKMLYTVDETYGYSAQSIPDNLPKFNDLDAKITKNIADISSNKQDIASNLGKVNANTVGTNANKQDIAALKAKDAGHDGDISQVKQDIVNLKNKDNSIDGDINDLSTDVQQHNIDIPKLKNDVQTNEDDIKSKADNDLSNVQGFATGKDGDLFYKKGGKLVVAPLKIDDTAKELQSKYSLVVPPNSVHFGLNTSIHENGGFLEYHTKSLNKNYLLLDYENDPATGTSKPIYYARGKEETSTIIQAVDDTVMNNVTSFDVVPAFSRQVQRMYFKLVNGVNNFKMKFEINGKVAEYPTGSWNDDTVQGFNLGTNLQHVDLRPFWSSLVTYANVKILIKADTPINMLGNGTLPWVAEDLNRITTFTMATMKDVTNAVIKDTAAEIRNKLQSLAGDERLGIEDLKDVETTISSNYVKTKLEELIGEDRLDANAIKNIPTGGGGGSTTFIGLTDTPASYLGNTNKFLKVNATHTALEFADGTVSGPESFVQLTDTPSNIEANKMLVGSTDGSNLIFKDIPADVDTSNLANKDLSNVEDSVFKTKGSTSGLLQKDLEDVDLAKLYDKGIDAKLADKTIQNELVTEVNRLKTDITNITPQTLPTFTWRDRGVPVVPNDKPYKAYYIHTIVLRDSTGIIDIPSNAPDGAIFSVENNDRDDYVNLRPGAGTTINGNSGVYQCGHDTLNFLVKDGSDWKLAYGGVFPNSLDSLKSTISVLFPNSLHTIAEVQAQLKDRLHTFREIQNEFSNQLHTEDEIETSMGAKGFLKGITLSDQRSNFFLEQDSVSFGNGFTTTQDPNNDKEVKIDYNGSGVNLEDMSGNVFTPEIIKSDLNDIEIHQVTNPDGSLSADLNIAPNAFKEKHNEGILAFLGNKELLNSKYPRLKLHFADTRVKGGSYVYQDLTDKSYVLQDTDPQDDPNVSGGTTFIVGGYIEPDDNEENTFTQDGFIDIEFVDDKGKILQDINDEPLGVRIAYKAGDKMRKELLIGEYIAKGQVKVHLRIRSIFPNEEIISIGANSCVMFQSTSKDESSGLALLSFMAFTGYLLRYYTRYFGTNSLNLSQFLIFDEPETELDNTTLDFGDNTHLDVVSRVKVSINDYKLNIKDNGLDLPIWSLYKHYNAQDTKYILGKDYKATVKLTDKNSAYDVSMLKYTGTKATAPKPNLLSYVNGNPTFNSGWSIVETMFISEDVVLGEHIATKTFVIPSDAKEIAIIMYANSAQIPQTLMLNSFEGDITPWFNKNILISNAHVSELSLHNADRKYRFENDLPKGSSSFRYTVNSTDTKMPWGTIHKDINGVGKVVNDRSWNTGGNTWINEGDGWFKEDGEVTLIYTARIYNEQNTDNEFMFKIIKVSDGSTVTGSEYSGNIKANTDKPLKITKTVTFNVKTDDKYRIIAKSNKDDGFYLKTNNISTSLLALDIDFKAITSVEKDVEKLKLDADEISFVDNNGAEVYNKYLQYNVDTGKMKVVDR